MKKPTFKDELEERIEYLREQSESYYETSEYQQRARERAERLEQLHVDLYGY